MLHPLVLSDNHDAIGVVVSDVDQVEMVFVLVQPLLGDRRRSSVVLDVQGRILTKVVALYRLEGIPDLLKISRPAFKLLLVCCNTLIQPLLISPRYAVLVGRHFLQTEM